MKRADRLQRLEKKKTRKYKFIYIVLSLITILMLHFNYWLGVGCFVVFLLYGMIVLRLKLSIMSRIKAVKHKTRRHVVYVKQYD